MKRIPSTPLMNVSRLAIVLMLSVAPAANAQTVSGIVVPGTANPFLSGMPNGSTASGGDVAPAQSPTQINGLDVSFGGFLTFTVTGSVSFVPTPSGDPPDGNSNVAKGAENGISGYTAPANALVGVFLDSTQPSLSIAPASLNFGGGGIGTAFTSLSPVLKQTFFIGDGRTGNGTGTVQQFNIPVGAQRLFLGTVDGTGWFNNSGQFNVSATRVGPTAVPEAGTITLVFPALGIAGLIALRRRRK